MVVLTDLLLLLLLLLVVMGKARMLGSQFLPLLVLLKPRKLMGRLGTGVSLVDTGVPPMEPKITRVVWARMLLRRRPVLLMAKVVNSRLQAWQLVAGDGGVSGLALVAKLLQTTPLLHP
jgi:hypothetical protein